MRFYVTEQISPKLSETPEGFLVCQDVPITRTGILLYGENEVPLEADSQGTIQIERNPEDVFLEETIKSFEGKPITISHPDDFVTPENWKDLAVGTIQNVRRGVNNEQDFMFADLLVTDESAIALVKGGLREVSCGYDADYEQLSPGRGKQKNIIGNHIALVSKGRAGARCAIGDSDNKEVQKMKWKDRIKKAFADFSKTIDEIPEEEKEKKTGDAGEAAGMEERLMAHVEKTVADCWKKTKDSEEEEKKKAEEEQKTKDAEEEEKKKEAEDKKTKDQEEEEKKKTEDAAYVKDMVSKAEILVPGYLTKDSMGKGKSATDIKREVLEASYKTPDGKTAIEVFMSEPVKDWKTVPQATIDMAFIGASRLLATQNNTEYSLKGIKTKDFGESITPAEINKRNAAHWASQKQGGK